jgi:membrane protein required for colicin V production
LRRSHDFEGVQGRMPSYLDLGVIGVCLVSAVLAMMRGFTREVLAIASWAAAAAAAYTFYPQVTPYLTPYIHKENVAQAGAAAIVFLIALVLVSLITVRISDMILDSAIGAIDRSLGFVFGALRGFLLAVVAFSLFNWLVGEQQQPAWMRTAKTRPMLDETAKRIIAMLPEDVGQQVQAVLNSKALGGAIDDKLGADPDAAPVPKATALPEAAPAPTPSASPAPADKAKLDQIIKGGVASPAPTPTPKKP